MPPRALIGQAVLLVALALSARLFVAVGWLRPIEVAGVSMAPHLSDGERLTLRPTATARRWDAVVVRSPLDARRLLVKRVVGLPGETVHFSQGDAWADGARLVKPADRRERLRVAIDTAGRWRADPGWRATGGGWLATAVGRLSLQGPVYDTLPANHAVTRRLNRVDDLSVTGRMTLAEGAACRVTLGGGEFHFDRSGTLLDGRRWEARLDGPFWFTCGTFDRVASLSIDGREVLTAPIGAPAGGGAEPVVLAALGRGVAVGELSVWRDVYYEAPPGKEWRLGPDEWFVVGDNQADSEDSRNWSARAGLPGRLIVGVVNE